MARNKKRPFIDRRLGFVVLFQRGNPTVDAGKIKTALDSKTRSSFSGFYVTDLIAADNPPQMKVVMSSSTATPSTLNKVRSMIEQESSRRGLKVKTIEVTSLALSPGDKVRNAMGV